MNVLLLILHLIPISTPPSIDRNSALWWNERKYCRFIGHRMRSTRLDDPGQLVVGVPHVALMDRILNLDSSVMVVWSTGATLSCVQERFCTWRLPRGSLLPWTVHLAKHVHGQIGGRGGIQNWPWVVDYRLKIWGKGWACHGLLSATRSLENDGTTSLQGCLLMKNPVAGNSFLKSSWNALKVSFLNSQSPPPQRRNWPTKIVECTECFYCIHKELNSGRMY